MNKIILLYDLFIQLKKIMVKENENNWIHAINNIINYLLSNKNAKDENYIVNEVRKKLQSIYGGMGSFSDYYIWRDNYEERVKENEKLDSILDQIWTILDYSPT